MAEGSNTTDQTQAEKIAALKTAIASWAEGERTPLVDEVEEKALQSTIEKATRLINHRPRSEHELRERLLGKDCEPEAVDEVIDRCKHNGMLDDEEFARLWVEQRSTHQKKSVAVLRRELKKKGVADHIIEATLDEVDPRKQQRIMVQLVEKKAQTIKTVPTDRKEYNKFLKRVVGVAARRGFPGGASFAAAKMALDDRIDELQHH